ncbi:hypothetical protein I2W78_17310 [Streptomyces spinoverrucosus]|uniref:hypothetical protein n=1 Tax=Streptomyces spinoverrucosus TaxID=284043 RepID=UPI0018C3A49E|nr:hypothetical protein [Streptomyces spinoverrucosus]MBG0853556.1 hypothetical protein [Streptomyces spinoverrucosus]
MATLYILDVPEFRALLDAVTSDTATTETVGDYVCVTTAEGPLVLERERIGARDAVWFSALTGGYSGTMARFDKSVLRLED